MPPPSSEISIRSCWWSYAVYATVWPFGETAGFVKMHLAKGKGKILGATIVAAHAGDLVSEITLAMAGKLGAGTLAKTIHPYPTQAEAIKKVGDAYNRTRLTPFVKGLFQKWLAWMR